MVEQGVNRTDEIDDIFTFPEGVLLPGKDNVITIVQVKTKNIGVSHSITKIDLCIG